MSFIVLDLTMLLTAQLRILDRMLKWELIMKRKAYVSDHGLIARYCPRT